MVPAAAGQLGTAPTVAKVAYFAATVFDGKVGCLPKQDDITKWLAALPIEL